MKRYGIAVVLTVEAESTEDARDTIAAISRKGTIINPENPSSAIYGDKYE